MQSVLLALFNGVYCDQIRREDTEEPRDISPFRRVDNVGKTSNEQHRTVRITPDDAHPVATPG